MMLGIFYYFTSKASLTLEEELKNTRLMRQSELNCAKVDVCETLYVVAVYKVYTSNEKMAESYNNRYVLAGVRWACA